MSGSNTASAGHRPIVSVGGSAWKEQEKVGVSDQLELRSVILYSGKLQSLDSEQLDTVSTGNSCL
jgi:hypothetical protein